MPTISLKDQIGAGEAHVGQVGGSTPSVTGQLIRASDATTYDIGDMIAQSTTAASVTPIDFTVTRSTTSNLSGRITGCRCTLTAASGTIVLPSFDLLLFRAATNIPFTAGSYPADNAALNVTSAAFQQVVAIFSFYSGSWRNQAGGSTAAGGHVYQSVTLNDGRALAPFNLSNTASPTILRGIMQAQSAWAPGAVQQTFFFALDVDED